MKQFRIMLVVMLVLLALASTSFAAVPTVRLFARGGGRLAAHPAGLAVSACLPA